MRTLVLVLFVGAFYLFSVVGSAYAQNVSEANCSEFYSFGSVQIEAYANKASLKPGEAARFDGDIENINNFPVVDGSVLVQIKKRIADDDAVSRVGMPVVDEFLLPETFSLAGRGMAPFTVSWTVPDSFSAGAYMAEFFFVVGDRVSLLGLPSMSNWAPGCRVNFEVSGDVTTYPFLRKESVKVGGEEYMPAMYFNRFADDETVEVEMLLENPLDTEAEVSLSRSLCEGAFAWDGCGGSSDSETLFLAPRERRVLRYSVEPNDFDGKSAVFRVVAQYGSLKSILDARILRETVLNPRIGFSGTLDYPLWEGMKHTLFSCIDSSDLTDGLSIAFRLLDENGNVVGSERYIRDISAYTSAFQLEVIPERTLTDFTLVTEVWREGILLDSRSVTYACSEIDSSLCGVESLSNESESDAVAVSRDESRWSPSASQLVVASLCVLALFVFVIRFFMKRNGIRFRRWFSVMIFSAIASGTCFPIFVEAKMTTLNQAYDVSLYHESFGSWKRGLEDPNLTVSYEAVIRDNDTGVEIPDGGSIPVGTTLRLETDTPEPNWYGTYLWGGLFEPFLFSFPSDPEGLLEAAWSEGASSPSVLCDIFRYSTGYKIFLFLDIIFYINYLSIDPPEVYVDTSSSTAGLSYVSDNVYTVTSSGNVATKFTFSDTYGKFYYDWTELYGTLIGLMFGTCFTWGGGTDPMRESGASSDYELPIPEQTIDYTITAYWPDTLEVCEETSSGLMSRTDGSSLSTIASGFTTTLYAFFDNSPGDCSGTEVTFDPGTSWSEVSDPDGAFTVNPGSVSTENLSGNIDNGSMLVSYSGQSVGLVLPGYCNWTASCSDKEDDYCYGEEFEITDPSCPGTRSCTGVRNCNTNFREVAPGE